MDFFLLYHFGYPQYPSRLPQFQILWRIFSIFFITKTVTLDNVMMFQYYLYFEFTRSIVSFNALFVLWLYNMNCLLHGRRVGRRVKPSLETKLRKEEPKLIRGGEGDVV